MEIFATLVGLVLEAEAPILRQTLEPAESARDVGIFRGEVFTMPSSISTWVS